MTSGDDPRDSLLVDLDDATLAVHAGDEPDEGTAALDPPIVMANAFAFESAADAAARFDGSQGGYVYTRWKNPTIEALERKVAALEGAQGAVALASGMAAVFGAIASNVRSGDHVVAPVTLYAETAKVLRERLARFGVETTFVDPTDPKHVAAAIRPQTRVVFAETPANPTLAITDLHAVAEIAHGAGAILVADNTFATPWHQRPLAHGADLVVHAATKGLGGHGDAVGGVVAGGSERLRIIRNDSVNGMGAAMSPFTAWLIARGVRTLPLRAARASESAAELARRLEADARIERVHYPGLPSHPGHAVATRQMRRGFGALVAFEVEGGLDPARQGYDALRVIARAVSLGDVRSLITHPASTTHHSMGAEARRAAGIADGLMRLSVGIEDVEDLWRDLDRALPR